MYIGATKETIATTPLITDGLYISGESVDWEAISSKHTAYFLEQMARHVYSGINWALEDGIAVQKLKGDTFHPIIFSKTDAAGIIHKLSIKLNKDESHAIACIDGRRQIDLPVRMQDGRLVIHGINNLRPPDAFMPENKMNRLLYWGDLKLFDYIADPLIDGQDEETELLRNITLSVSVGKLIKRFRMCRTTVPHSFRRALLNKHVHSKYARETVAALVEDTPAWTIERHVSTSYWGELKNKGDTVADTLIEAYQMFLDSPLRSEEVEDMVFRFMPEGTRYEMAVLFSGKIKRIKFMPEVGKLPTAEEIIEMSHWANRELVDLVDKAAICKKIETTYEPDTESETTEVCGL